MPRTVIDKNILPVISDLSRLVRFFFFFWLHEAYPTSQGKKSCFLCFSARASLTDYLTNSILNNNHRSILRRHFNLVSKKWGDLNCVQRCKNCFKFHYRSITSHYTISSRIHNVVFSSTFKHYLYVQKIIQCSPLEIKWPGNMSKMSPFLWHVWWPRSWPTLITIWYLERRTETRIWEHIGLCYDSWGYCCH